MNLNCALSVGRLGLYFLVILFRQTSPRRGRMIYVLVPQHVLTLMSLDSAAEGRERAWGEADGLQMLVLKCVDACTSLGFDPCSAPW